MKAVYSKTIMAMAILFLYVCSAGSVRAGDSSEEKSWEFTPQLYFWGASVGGSTAAGGDVEVDLDDILDNLEFAIMGSLEANKGKWLLAIDMIYLDVGNSAAIAPGIDVSADLTSWVVTPMAGYNLVNTGKGRLDLIGGARYLSVDTELMIDAAGARADESASNWDAIVGTRGSVDFAQNWYLFGLLDVGAGDSDLTWQAMGGIGYRFDSFNVVAAYRYIAWEFSDDIKLLDDLALHGPAVGINFTF